MKLSIEIAMDNAAFGDTSVDAAAEVAQILRPLLTDRFDRLIDLIRHEGQLPLRDSNGNIIGLVEVDGE